MLLAACVTPALEIRSTQSGEFHGEIDGICRSYHCSLVVWDASSGVAHRVPNRCQKNANTSHGDV